MNHSWTYVLVKLAIGIALIIAVLKTPAPAQNACAQSPYPAPYPPAVEPIIACGTDCGPRHTYHFPIVANNGDFDDDIWCQATSCQ